MADDEQRAHEPPEPGQRALHVTAQAARQHGLRVEKPRHVQPVGIVAIEGVAREQPGRQLLGDEQVVGGLVAVEVGIAQQHETAGEGQRGEHDHDGLGEAAAGRQRRARGRAHSRTRRAKNLRPTGMALSLDTPRPMRGASSVGISSTRSPSWSARIDIWNSMA